MGKAKGFKTGKGQQKTAEITFAEGHRLHGISVEVQLRVPVGVVLGASSGDISRALKPFIKRIVAWNVLDDDDSPVPVSEEAFGEHFDMEETGALLSAWVEVVTQSAPLSEQSASAGLSATG